MMDVGLWSIGTYLPDTVRTNDWWPASIVESWQSRRPSSVVRDTADGDETLTEGMRRTLEAMKSVGEDPFKGAVERRVMSGGMTASDMELHASQDALARAGVEARDIDLILTYSQVPDYIGLSTAATLHKRLGLSPSCLSLGVETACNSFSVQLSLAAGMIRSGQARRALIVQSAGAVHFSRPEDAHSAWFGDAATAAVVGPVSAGRGLRGQAHRTDGALYRALVNGCPGGQWYNGERPHLYNEDRPAARQMLLRLADMARDSIEAALAEAGCTPDAVDYYASHQATRWLRPLTQSYAGLTRARAFDTFTFTGSISACNVPFMLAMGEREGLLREGDWAVGFSGGTGVTWSAIALKWGK